MTGSGRARTFKEGDSSTQGRKGGLVHGGRSKGGTIDTCCLFIQWLTCYMLTFWGMAYIIDSSTRVSCY